MNLSSLAFAQSTDNLVIGSVGKDRNAIEGVGAVYVFDNIDSILGTIESPELVHSQFGQKIISKDNKLAISAPWKYDVAGKAEGTVYVFDVTTGKLLFTIKNPEPNGMGEFGVSTTFVGSNIAVGFPTQKVGGYPVAGTVYVFDGNSGKLLNTIKNPEPSKGGSFGNSVASIGSNIVVGFPSKNVNGIVNAGAVYVFDSITGNQIMAIDNPEPKEQEEFGKYLTASEDKILIGTPFMEVDGNQRAGGVYLYDGTSGSLLKAIPNPDPDELGHFGKGLAFSGNNLIIGAPGNGLFDSGSVFIIDETTFKVLKTIDNPQKIKIHDHPWANEFGHSIITHGGKIIVGDPGKVVDEKPDAGAVYIIDAKSGSILQTIDNPTPSKNDSFGYSVGIIGDIPVDSLTKLDEMQTKDSQNAPVDSLVDLDESLKIEPEKTTSDSIKATLEWEDAKYTLGGYGILKLADNDMNRNKELVDILQIHVWSNTDKKGIMLDMVETNRDTGIFYGDTMFVDTESGIQQIKVANDDTVYASYDDMSSGNAKNTLLAEIKLGSIYYPVGQQSKSGISLDNVSCMNPDHKLVIKDNSKPMCVSQETYEKLVRRGYL